MKPGIRVLCFQQIAIPALGAQPNFPFPDPFLGAERALVLWKVKGKYFCKSKIRAPKLAEARSWLEWWDSGYKDIC